MPSQRSKKETPSTGKRAVGKRRVAPSVSLKNEVDRATTEWIEQNDPLIDKAETNPITIDVLLSDKLGHRSFVKPGVGEVKYDWSIFREVLEKRSPSSPRWFVQLREEDLLLDPDGLDGVTVDCFIIAEASKPTLAPAEYIVKQHWPYSDIEDNAPERIHPIAGQGMCWRRITRHDGTDINAYLLQRRGDLSDSTITGAQASWPASGSAPAASFGFGGLPSSAANTSTTAPTASFTFDQAPPTTVPSTSAASFGFGFGASAPTPSSTSAPSAAFGFGAVPASSVAAPAFGFGAPSPVGVSTPIAPGFSFGDGNSGSLAKDGDISIQRLKPSDVLFALWSKSRLKEIMKEMRSGSRIVREDFTLDESTKIKLIMQNDRKDDVSKTVRLLIRNRLFARQNKEVQDLNEWVDNCPVYDEKLAASLQKFRERYIEDLAEESDAFADLYRRHHGKMEQELQRIVDLRDEAVEKEMATVTRISALIADGKLAEKNSFRLLKYYAKNDAVRFRPFGKVSGISEMGEVADVCVPPAHVNVNPFTSTLI